MNFLYDLTATQSTPSSKFHGGGTYAEIVFHKLLEKYDASKYLIYGAFDSKRFLNNDIIEDAKLHNVVLFDINAEPIAQLFKRLNVTKFYSALLDETIPWPLDGISVITTVHGLRSLEMPHEKIIYLYESHIKERVKSWLKLTLCSNHYFNKVKKGYARFFTGKMSIITVSEHSKASILSFFPDVDPDSIKVFSSPTFDQLESYGTKTTTTASMLPHDILSGKYFLMTSGAVWIKNNMRSVFALDELFTEHHDLFKDYKAVITGVTDKRIFERHIKNQDRFVFFDYIDRGTLAAIEKNAFAFIYPTLNEGFGYPPIESMKYGVPVITSGISAVPEVCGDAVLYFNPLSVSEIKNRIIQLMNKNIYDTLKEKSITQYKLISSMQSKDLNDMIDYLLA